MVDYSKWDRMDFGDSDSDGDDGGGAVPRVTSLDRPGRVTIGPDGSLDVETSGGGAPSSARPPQPPEPSRRPTTRKGIPTVSGSAGGDVVDISDLADERQIDEASRLQRWRSRLTHNGGEHRCTVAAADGKEVELPVYWSQDRCAVTLRLVFPPELFPTRGIRVRAKGALQYADRFSAVGSGVAAGPGTGSDDGSTSYGSVTVVSLSDRDRGETVLLDGKLPRPIHLNEDEDEIDFEIEDNPDEKAGGSSEGGYGCTKLVTITMPKAVPMAGMVLWWDRPLVGYPLINVSAIGERKGGGNGDDDRKNEAFQRAWDEAHVMFREKMKTKKKQSIDINDWSAKFIRRTKLKLDFN